MLTIIILASIATVIGAGLALVAGAAVGTVSVFVFMSAFAIAALAIIDSLALRSESNTQQKG